MGEFPPMFPSFSIRTVYVRVIHYNTFMFPSLPITFHSRSKAAFLNLSMTGIWGWISLHWRVYLAGCWFPDSANWMPIATLPPALLESLCPDFPREAKSCLLRTIDLQPLLGKVFESPLSVHILQQLAVGNEDGNSDAHFHFRQVLRTMTIWESAPWVCEKYQFCLFYQLFL